MAGIITSMVKEINRSFLFRSEAVVGVLQEYYFNDATNDYSFYRKTKPQFKVAAPGVLTRWQT
jgi:hypothetical protein